MTDILLKELNKRGKPITIIQVGMGFMGYGFYSSVYKNKNFVVQVVISRRPLQTLKFLKKNNHKAILYTGQTKLDPRITYVTDDLRAIDKIKADCVFEVTGTVDYGSEVAFRAINSKKHLITMNPELQVSLGSELKYLADKNKVVITDVLGDQPGSLSRLIQSARFMGYRVHVAGNMKRFMDKHATQKKMKPWAMDKGLAVKQTTSFTDGTKQSIEMSLVANYFGFKLLKSGMKGPRIEKIEEILGKYDIKNLPKEGIVDYAIGISLFPGIFVIVSHKDPQQKKYLRYLGLGEGPYYVLFEPYHLCHLEVSQTIAKAVLFNEETIDNSRVPSAQTYAYAKRNIKKGEVLDGIGGDLTYGTIENLNTFKLPAGLTEGCVALTDIKKNKPVKLSQVSLPDNFSTKLLGLKKNNKSHLGSRILHRLTPFN